MRCKRAVVREAGLGRVSTISGCDDDPSTHALRHTNAPKTQTLVNLRSETLRTVYSSTKSDIFRHFLGFFSFLTVRAP